jgi:hypothetical protein
VESFDKGVIKGVKSLVFIVFLNEKSTLFLKKRE